jgi:hypothetical protein
MNIWNFMREISRSLIGLILVATVLGCGGDPYGPTGKISGKLTMDGKPLPAGYAVSFMQMQSGFLAYGTTDAEGKFVVNTLNDGNMPIGKYDVMVAPPGGEGSITDEDLNMSAEERFEKQQQTGTPLPKKGSIPLKYRQTTTSGLSYEVKEGENNFDIDLQSK